MHRAKWFLALSLTVATSAQAQTPPQSVPATPTPAPATTTTAPATTPAPATPAPSPSDVLFQKLEDPLKESMRSDFARLESGADSILLVTNPDGTHAIVTVPRPVPVAAPAIVAPPPPPPVEKHPMVQLLSLRLMRDKGILTAAEYESALHDLGDSLGALASDSLSLVLGNWSTTLYGFAETDFIYDSTQSFTDIAGNTLVLAPSSMTVNLGAVNPRVQFSIRNSRIGFRLRAPEFHGIRASAVVEMDFEGSQPTTISEAAFFNNPTFRARHAYLKVETPILDVLVGQYWQLFGWQTTYHPNTVEIQGVPGQLYARTAQLRLSKTLKSEYINFDIAVAVARPPDRDSAIPDGQGGVRLAINRWTGVQTTGATATSIAPASIALTGVIRGFQVPEFAAKPTTLVGPVNKAGGFAVDAFLPVVPGTKNKMGNSLSLVGEYAYGFGIADLYTSLGGGITNAALPNPNKLNPAPTYTPDIDGGLVAFGTDGALHAVGVESFLVGAQYYLPGLDGNLWLSANYSRLRMTNLADLGLDTSSKVRSMEEWADINLFWNPIPAVRLGVEYAYFLDHYADGKTLGTNHRAQLSAWYLF